MSMRLLDNMRGFRHFNDWVQRGHVVREIEDLEMRLIAVEAKLDRAIKLVEEKN